MVKRCNVPAEAFSQTMIRSFLKAASTDVNDFVAITYSTEIQTDEIAQKLKSAACCAKVVFSIISTDIFSCGTVKGQVTDKGRRFTYMYKKSVCFVLMLQNITLQLQKSFRKHKGSRIRTKSCVR